MSSQLVWLITGTSTGLGRDLTLLTLKRGDKVIATTRGRSLAKLDDLKAQGADTLELDVTWPLEKLQQVMKEAVEIHGRIDVLVNNAGYFLVGALEENSPEETLQQFNANVFGALNVTRAVLPHMRARKSGTIVWAGSIVGWHALANAGVYAASKAAVRSLSETLHAEISPIGLRSICIDFGYFRTAFLNSEHRMPHLGKISDYKEVTEEYERALQEYNGKQPGDPIRGCQVILDLVRDEGIVKGKGAAVPTNLQLGSDTYNTVKPILEKHIKVMEDWKDVTLSTDFPEGEK
ncbi:NAD(P)-binding protein [Dendrothele bispora CBS 962.96]|uniref:NAD(P)-binding protein n=1 Tax=Dendrothele bispora (strain CBS 962.96) TaxID=1314807 RepID=A0A4S8LDG8_DENBC|nr:NAD(P)-binding protein [Dendrothele bispora CBS 962.96]